MESGKPRGAKERTSRAAVGTWPSSAGWRVAIPGHAQWSWGQRERGLIFFGSFAVALGVGAFAWGTWAGLLLFGIAFGTHVLSVLDAVRQTAFPIYARWMTLVSTSGGLAAGVYAPMLGVATLFAWPALAVETSRDGYLVNRRAYAGGTVPARGDWIWFRVSSWKEGQVGRVLASAGQEVEWSENRLRIDGVPQWQALPFRPAAASAELVFAVPEGYVLVLPQPSERATTPPSGSVLVPRDQIAGRAWACFYPVWKRQLLR